MRRLLKRLESAIMRACVAEMAEQVDARDSKSRAARRAGSIPALGTSSIQQNKSDLHDVTVAFFIPAVQTSPQNRAHNYESVLKHYSSSELVCAAP
jgi:hypothetical protein